MSSLCLPNPNLDRISPYDPKYLSAKIYLSANENPYSLPGCVVEEITQKIKNLSHNRYPDPLADGLRSAIADKQNQALYNFCGFQNPNKLFDKNNVLVGNAGDELLFDIALAWGGNDRNMLIFPPTFSVYSTNALLTNTCLTEIRRNKDFSLDEKAILAYIKNNNVNLIFLTSPNNPTGNSVSIRFVRDLLESSNALVVIDEAYIEFSKNGEKDSFIQEIFNHENLVILRTFSKAYSAAGIRLGYILAQNYVIEEIIKVRQPYSVDAISQIVGSSILAHNDIFENRIKLIKEERDRLYLELNKRPYLKVYPSNANFFLIKIDHADIVWDKLYKQGILVRDFSHSPFLNNCLRISVGTRSENNTLLDALDRCESC